jgi:hypothetical protein
MFENHPTYNCRVTLADGNEYQMYASWLANNDQHHWQGWHCEAGVTRIHIDKNLQVWSGECNNDRLGDIFTGWDLFDGHSVCHRETCTGCTDDLLAAKWKP